MNSSDMDPKDVGSGVSLLGALRITVVTWVVCGLLYPGVILLGARTISPHTAEGSLIRDSEGRVIGSERLAQGFSRPEYFWPRPSAVEFHGMAAGGSNLSPASLALRSRVEGTLASLGVSSGDRVPADLLMASGSGLDPDISLSAAMFQADRVARARGLKKDAVLRLIDSCSRRPGRVLTPEAVVNVLLMNRRLDLLGH